MRLVERRLEVHAVVGEAEAFAPAEPGFRQFDGVHALLARRPGVDQPQRVEARRLLEQHAGRMALSAFRVVERPGRIARRRLQRLGRGGLVGEPAHHPLREDLLRDRQRHMGAERGLHRRAVQRGGLRRAHRARGAALHEEPLAAIDGRERRVPPCERPNLRLDAKERRQEGFELRRERQDEVGVRFSFPPFARGAERARRLQPFAERRIEAGQKERIEAREAAAAIKVLEGEAVGEGEVGHLGQGGGSFRAAERRPTLPAAASLSN